MKFLHNISRIEAFSDAVFAFAATLMVVSLEAVDGLSVLKISFTGFIGFAISFFVLIMLWKMHYNFFRRTNYVDNWIIAYNSVLLFVVLYYVFPLKSMIATLINLVMQNEGSMTKDELVQLFMLYGIGFFLIFLCISLMYYRAYKKTKEIDSALILLFYTRHFAIFAIVAVLSIALSITEIGLNLGIPGFIYSLIGLFCYMHAKQFNKKHNTLL